MINWELIYKSESELKHLYNTYRYLYKDLIINQCFSNSSDFYYTIYKGYLFNGGWRLYGLKLDRKRRIIINI